MRAACGASTPVRNRNGGDTRTREDCRLDRDLIGRAGMNAPTGAAIFAFRVLADAQDIETITAKGSLNAWQQPVRPYVGILRESFADRQEQSVKRYGVGHLRWPPHSAEIDRIEFP